MDNAVLIINQDRLERRYIAALLAADGLHEMQVGGVLQGLISLIDMHPALMVIAEETNPLDPSLVISVVRRLTSAPLIIVGGGGQAEEVSFLAGGGDVYLRRPLNAVDLMARTRALLRRTKRDLAVSGADDAQGRFPRA